MSTASKNLLRFLCASVAVMLLAAALNFVVDPLQLFRPARFCSAAMYSQDSRMQDAGLIRSQDFRHGLHGHLAGDPFPAERHRPGPRRPLAEAVDDRFDFARAEFRA